MSKFNLTQNPRYFGYIFLAVVVSVFNLMMIFFAAGYIDNTWNINGLTEKVLGLSFVGMFVINTVMIVRGYYR